MRIELEEPYKSMFKTGYLNVGTDGRRRVWFTDQNGITVFGTSYARYLMSVKLGYLVPDHLEVDHKDDDFTNDDINNLQLLTQEQNLLKQQLNYINNVQEVYGFHCAWCSTPFLLTLAEVNERTARGKELAFCSQLCGARHFNSTQGLSQEEKNKIKELRSQGFTSYQIADATGYSRNTVMKHWN